jgi:chromosome partitioning protein
MMNANIEDLPTLSPLEVDLEQRVPPAGAAEIRTLSARAAHVLQAAVDAALEPERKKSLRKWNQTETAEILGISRKTIDRWLDEREGNEPTIPTGERVEGRGPRLFSLEEIHKIQELKGLRPWRDPATDETAILAIANFKGGVAKSTTAVPCAQYFARKGYRVLLIDSDPQGSSTTAFGIRPDQDVEQRHTLGPWLKGASLVDDPADWTGTLESAIQPTYWHGLDLIAGNLQLYGAEFSLAARRIQDPNLRFYRVLHDGLKTVTHRYDIIIIDTPPSLSYLTTNALYAANGLIMPVPPAMMDFASSVSFFALLAELFETFDPVEKEPKVFKFLATLVTKVEAGKPEHEAIEDWLRQAFPKRVLKHTMGLSAAIRMGADIKTPYEIDKYEGDRRTLVRALGILDGVNGEIERLVRSQWPSTRAAKEVRA